MDNRKDHKTMQRYAKAALSSVLIGALVTVVMLFLGAIIVSFTNVAPIVVDILALISGAAGGIAAGYFMGKILKEKGMLFGALCGGILILILLIFQAVFSEFTSTGMTLLKLFLILLASMIGGVRGVNKKPKRIRY